VRISIFKKIAVAFLSLLFLNGCVEPTAFLGPAITAGTSGNIYQASLSYGTNQVIQKATGKTSIEHISEFFDPKNKHQGDWISILNYQAKETKLNINKQQQDFFTMVKKIYNENNY